MGIDTEYDDSQITQRGEGRNNQSIIIDTGKHLAVVAVCAALCGVAGALSVWAAYTATRAEREARMLQYYTMELDGKLMQRNIIKPEESLSAKEK